jgi:hypothetical protein
METIHTHRDWLQISTRHYKTTTTPGVSARRGAPETVHLQIANSYVMLTFEEARRLAIFLIEAGADEAELSPNEAG